jgi:tetratricopeptide (TPR) repeat protein
MHLMICSGVSLLQDSSSFSSRFCPQNRYAPAWAQRSQVLGALASVALNENIDGFRRARESADKAIALDPALAAGYLALGLIQINHDWDWEGADISLKKAGLLEPGSAAVLGNRAYLARNLGHVDEAIELYKQAIALDPLRAIFIWHWATSCTSWAGTTKRRPCYKGLRT